MLKAFLVMDMIKNTDACFHCYTRSARPWKSLARNSYFTTFDALRITHTLSCLHQDLRRQKLNLSRTPCTLDCTENIQCFQLRQPWTNVPRDALHNDSNNCNGKWKVVARICESADPIFWSWRITRVRLSFLKCERKPFHALIADDSVFDINSMLQRGRYSRTLRHGV